MEDKEIISYLEHLAKVYTDLEGDYLEVALCGGAALNLLGYVKRATQDIDIVSPERLPKIFTEAAQITADYFGLKKGWINQGPIDLLRMGLPSGFFRRCKKLEIPSNLLFLIAERLDQIHFKLYASIDRGGVHLQDLLALTPTDEELVMAATWCFTHDVSPGFREVMVDFLEKQGWQNVVSRIAK